MDKQQAINFYGSQSALAVALGIKQPSVCSWKAIPAIRQLQLEALTAGALKADTGILPRRTKKVTPSAQKNKTAI